MENAQEVKILWYESLNKRRPGISTAPETQTIDYNITKAKRAL